jgi:hypothetical protein
MLALERTDVRRFRAVARRGGPNGRPKGPAPPVKITDSGRAVTLACHLGEVVVALRGTPPQPGKGSVTVTLADLDAIEGGSGVVTLDPSGTNKLMARWDASPAPRTARLDTFETHRHWPAEPDRLVAMPPTLPRALHEVGRSAARDPGKYAVTRVQVRGKDGELVGTDGKQALVWGGFTFPFAEDLLVPAVPLFGSKELAGEAAVSVGLDKEWLYVVIGPWQVWLAVDREGRFPDVRGAAPRSCPTRVTFDDRDVATLLDALPGLPGTTEFKSVTLDLGPAVVVRAHASASHPVAEVPLPFTAAGGPPVRVALDRDHLGRALALGLRELRVSSPERPVVFRDGDRTYLTATLDPSCAVPPPPAGAGAIGESALSISPSPLAPIRERTGSMAHRNDPPTDRNGHADPPTVGDPVDPLAEAEALRAALAEAANRAHRLLGALKQYRRERRSLQAAWSSLRQLNLGP